MSPVIGVGPRCTRCHKRPVWGDTFEIRDADHLEFERSLAASLSGST